MSCPATLTRTDAALAAAACLMRVEEVKRLPVVDDAGRLLGVVTRSGLLKVHLRPGGEIQ